MIPLRSGVALGARRVRTTPVAAQGAARHAAVAAAHATTSGGTWRLACSAVAGSGAAGSGPSPHGYRSSIPCRRVVATCGQRAVHTAVLCSGRPLACRGRTAHTPPPARLAAASHALPAIGGARRPIVWNSAVGSRRQLGTASLVTADTQLDAFAEAQKAREMLEEGRGGPAASLLSRVVDICERATGGDSDLTLAALRRLGSAYMQAGEYEKARVVIERMLKTAQAAAAGDGDASGSSSSVQLALLEQGYRLHLHLGAPRRAQELCRRAEQLSESVGDWSGVVAAQAASDLADIMRGHPSKHGFTKAIATAEAADSCSPFTLATVWRNRGALLFATRHQSRKDPLVCFDKSLALLREAAAATCSGGAEIDLEAAGGPGALDAALDDPVKQCRVVELSEAGVRVAQGYCQMRLGHVGDAMKTVTKALKTYEKWLDPEHPSLARSLSILGALHHETQKAVTAEGLYRAAIDKFRAAPVLLPYQRRDYKLTYLLYAHLLSQWDRREGEAADMLKKAKQLHVFPACAFAEDLLPVSSLVAAGSENGGDARAELELCSAPSSLYAIGGIELELQHVHCAKCHAASSAE